MTTTTTQKIIEHKEKMEKYLEEVKGNALLRYHENIDQEDISNQIGLVGVRILTKDHQHLIELLEAEVEKWKGMRAKDLNKVKEVMETDRLYNLMNENMVFGFNSALDLLITEKEQTIKELKEMR